MFFIEIHRTLISHPETQKASTVHCTPPHTHIRMYTHTHTRMQTHTHTHTHSDTLTLEQCVPDINSGLTAILRDLTFLDTFSTLFLKCIDDSVPAQGVNCSVFDPSGF